MIITSFNVNSIKARLDILQNWLQEFQPDIVLLQETKTVDTDFPILEMEATGYSVAYHGQKSYNGVAILSKHPIKDVSVGIPDFDDDQARYIQAEINNIVVGSVYLPNGNPVDSDKFPYKLRWMDALHAHMKKRLLPCEKPIALGGDFNLVPREIDCYNPEKLRNDAIFHDDALARFYAMKHLGFIDAWEVLHGADAPAFTYWDYVRARFDRDEGLRIDHFLLSASAADMLMACDVDQTPRRKEKPSDHTPIWCKLEH
ncbi:MAG: exodeoxyribonuclease III [Pseudomonadota bacterium]